MNKNKPPTHPPTIGNREVEKTPKPQRLRVNKQQKNALMNHLTQQARSYYFYLLFLFLFLLLLLFFFLSFLLMD